MITNYSNEPVKKGEMNLFLAGPTPRSMSVSSWRPRALDILKYLGYKGIVYIPERDFDDRTFNYDDQIEWESEALANADVIVFWVPRKLPEMPAFTTNVEFGEWFKSGKIVYGRPDNSEKNRYLDKRYVMQIGQDPFNNLEDLLKEAVRRINKKESIDMGKFYELTKIAEVMEHYPESRHLIGDVQFTPESYGMVASDVSYGKILFPDVEDEALNEFNRTMLSVILYYYIRDNLYERFTACQQGALKLTEESFNELREFVLSAIDTKEKEQLLIYYLVINDLGKSKYMINKLKEIGIESIDHDIVLSELVDNKMLPSFEMLTPEYQNNLRNILKNGINLGQFIQGECTSYSLKPLIKLNSFEINIMLIEAMLDIAGVLGHKEQNGSMVFNQPTAENFILGARVISSSDSVEKMQHAFNTFLDKRADKYGFGKCHESTRRAITRISLMLRLSSKEDTEVVRRYLKEGRDNSLLIHELNVTGFNLEKAILMYYSPALLNNARAYFKKENNETALEETLVCCLPFFERVLTMARQYANDKSNGEITVMLREAAMIASQNPRELDNFDVSTLSCE